MGYSLPTYTVRDMIAELQKHDPESLVLAYYSRLDSYHRPRLHAGKVMVLEEDVPHADNPESAKSFLYVEVPWDADESTPQKKVILVSPWD